MNINTSGIINKLKTNADWVAAAVAIYSRAGGNLDDIWKYYFSEAPLREAAATLGNLKRLKYKLWDSPHMYTGLFKGATIARLLAEINIVPPKYKKTAEKVMWGSAIVAIMAPGSGVGAPQRSAEQRMYNRVVRGIQGNPYHQELYAR